MTWLWPVLLASLVGSLHCVGMCGGLVSFYSVASAGVPSQRGSQRTGLSSRGLNNIALSHVAYHLSRLLGYTGLGAAAGQLGKSLEFAGSLAGVQQGAALLTGATMILWGSVALLKPRGREPLIQLGKVPLGKVPLGKQTLPELWARGLSQVRKTMVSITRRARSQPPVSRAAVLGISTALLPCGWLYVFVLAAAGTANGARGALLMLAFWAGTVPALLGLGVGVQWLGARLQPLLPRLSAVVLVCLGFANLVGRWPTVNSAEAAAISCHAER